MTKDFKSKKYQGVYYRTLDDDSKTFYIVYKHPMTKKTQRLKIGNSKSGFSEAYCNNKRNEIVSSLRLGQDINIPILRKKLHKITLHEIALKYFETLKIKSSDRNYKNVYGKYQKHLLDISQMPINAITKQDIINIQKAKIKKGLANKTINNIINQLGTIFIYAIKNDLYNGVNVVAKINNLKVNNQRQRYLNKDEVYRLLESVENDYNLYLFVLLSVNTGGRLDTILSITKKDIDMTNNHITLRDFKSGGYYKGALVDKVKNIINDKIKTLKKDDYIIGVDGVKLSHSAIQRNLNKHLNNLFNVGLKKDDRINRVVLHTLRHTFASLLAINGTAIYTIAKLMNHKDIKQTMRYAKLSPSSGFDDVKSLF